MSREMLIDAQGSKEPEGIVFCHNIQRMRLLLFESQMSLKAHMLKAWCSACGIIRGCDRGSLPLKKILSSPSSLSFSLLPGFRNTDKASLVLICHHDVLYGPRSTQGYGIRD